MVIKVWGARGSIPSPGTATQRYGGNSTCIEIRTAAGQILVVDAGSGARNLGRALQRNRNASSLRFFFTHGHWDHLMGFPFFAPAYSADYTIVCCGGPHAEGTIRRFVAHQMEPPFFPVSADALKARFVYRCDRGTREPGNCCLQGLEFRPVPLNHPNGGYGYKFMENGKTFVFLSDNELNFQHEGGLSRAEYVEFCRHADVLFHDAQYTEEEYDAKRGWGHSTYGDATELALDAGVRRLVFVHHDPDRSDDEMDRQVERCRGRVSESGSAMECLAAAEGMVLGL